MEKEQEELLYLWCVARYVQLLDAGMNRCQRIGEPLTDEQRFELLTAGQLLFGNWHLKPGEDNPPFPNNGWVPETP